MKTKPEENLLHSLHAFNQLNNRIVQQIGTIFNFNAEEYCSMNGIIYNIIKDNPVPSLDSDINVLLSKHEYLFAFREDKAYKLRKKIKKLLQNGVETNNKQPNGCFYEYKTYKSPLYKSNKKAYKEAEIRMGNKFKKQIKNIVFTEVINGSEERFTY